LISKKQEKKETVVRLPVLFSVTLYVANGCGQDCSLVSAIARYQGSEHAFSLSCEFFCWSQQIW